MKGPGLQLRLGPSSCPYSPTFQEGMFSEGHIILIVLLGLPEILRLSSDTSTSKKELKT